MELNEIIRPGLVREEIYLVSEEHTAAHIGSGSLRVLATPWMIAYMERAARNLLAEHLPQGFSSVGVRVDIRHLAPTAAGSQVTARVEIQSVEGWKVDFSVEAHDEKELIGNGRHQRVVIDEARFLRRVEGKV